MWSRLSSLKVIAGLPFLRIGNEEPMCHFDHSPGSASFLSWIAGIELSSGFEMPGIEISPLLAAAGPEAAGYSNSASGTWRAGMEGSLGYLPRLGSG